MPKFYFSTIVQYVTFPRMSNSGFSTGTPQFSTAQYASKGGADRCKSCDQPSGDTYYRVNDDGIETRISDISIDARLKILRDLLCERVEAPPRIASRPIDARRHIL